MNLISIGDRGNVWHAYRGECGSACGCRRTKCNGAGHIAVNGSVSAGVGDVAMEGGDGFEKVGVGFGIAIKVFNVGKDAA